MALAFAASPSDSVIPLGIATEQRYGPQNDDTVTATVTVTTTGTTTGSVSSTITSNPPGGPLGASVDSGMLRVTAEQPGLAAISVAVVLKSGTGAVAEFGVRPFGRGGLGGGPLALSSITDSAPRASASTVLRLEPGAVELLFSLVHGGATSGTHTYDVTVHARIVA